MVRFKVGLFEKDLAGRFYISISQVSKIFTTFVNVMRLELKQMHSSMPTQEEVRNVCLNHSLNNQPYK